MNREVIQIAVTPTGKIVALCSDSTIWVKDNEWIQVTHVPGVTPEDDDGV